MTKKTPLVIFLVQLLQFEPTLVNQILPLPYSFFQILFSMEIRSNV